MSKELILLLLFGCAGVLISLVCNYLLLNFSQNLGIRNKNDVVIRWSNQSKPSLGGISFFVVFVFACMATAIFLQDLNIFKDIKVVGFILAASLAFFMGLADDAFNTKPWLKFLVQLACGVILAFTNSKIDIFGIDWLSIIATILWVVILMNSLNMLDNMDGITTSTVIMILLSCLLVNFFYNGMIFTFESAISISILGALLGFLKFNSPPSKIFMGDAGSQFIGLAIAYVTIHSLWQTPTYSGHSFLFAIPIVLVAMSGAAADTLTVFINRIKAGKSPMVGGKDHTTHHLVYSGKSEKQVWHIFVIIGIFSVIISTITACFILPQYPRASYFIILYFIFVFYYLYRNTVKFKQLK